MATFLQYLFFGTLHGPVTFWLRATVKAPEDLTIEQNKSLIIAANHHSMADPFLLVLLPWRFVKNIIPIHAPTIDHYYKKWWLKLFIKPMGAYSIAGQGWTLEDFLGGSLEKLQQGKKIIFFPEGRLVENIDTITAKPGIIYLAKKSGAQILPVHIQGLLGASLWDILLRRRPVSIDIGKQFTFSKPISNYEEASRASVEIMDAIYGLR